MKSIESFVTSSNSEHTVPKTKLSTDFVKETENMSNCDKKKSATDQSEKCANSCMELYSPSGNNFDENSNIETNNESYDYSDNINNMGVTIQRYLSSDSPASHCHAVVAHSKDEYHSLSASQDIQAEDSYLSSKTIQLQSSSTNLHSELPTQQHQMAQPNGQFKSAQITEVCRTAFDSKFLNSVTNMADSVLKESSYSTEEEKYSIIQICSEDSEYKQSREENNLKENGEYKHFVGNDSEYKQAVDIESCYKQTVKNKDTALTYKQPASKKEVSSYKQHPVDDAEEMDTDVLDEDDVLHVTVSPSIYQSYEEDSMAAHYQTAAMAELVNMSAIVNFDTSDSPADGWNSASRSDDSASSVVLSGSQIPNGETFTNTQNTVTEVATSCNRDSIITTTCSSASSRRSGSACEEDHEAALCTGDQTFKSAAARQSALVPFMPAGCSLPYVSGINPSMYAGAAMVQGLGRPTVMTSSSVHIAQHPGGATIMQHQTMSTGINGGMAQATVMQQQAMANGVQATAVMQHRTLTSGGQTMVVQQRTMTTGLGGLAQQTVVQQRVGAPGNIAHAAMYHANAMRQRTLATQQAHVLQQRGIRLVPTRMMGNTILQSHALNNAGLIRGSTVNPAALMGHGLMRGVNQGALMQHLVRQRYLGGPIMPGRGMQVMAGRPIRIKMTYSRESLPVDT